MKGRVALLLLAAAALLAVTTSVAAGAFSDSASSSMPVSTLTVGGATSPSVASADGCVTAQVTWARGANAATYSVEVERDGGEWVSVSTDTGDVTSLTDTTPTPPGGSVRYRITSRHVPSGWTGQAAVTSPMAC